MTSTYLGTHCHTLASLVLLAMYTCTKLNDEHHHRTFLLVTTRISSPQNSKISREICR